MTALPLLFCSLALAAEPPPTEAAPAERPATATATRAPTPASDWDETSPPEGESAPPAPPVRTGLLAVTMAGVEVLVPRIGQGRRFEQPVALAFESERRLAAGLAGGLHGSIGYAQLSRTRACDPELTFCRPLLGVALGGALRVNTPPDARVVGWIGLGAGITAAANWARNLLGVYARADAGVDLRFGRQQVRFAAGWVQAALTENQPEFEPGHQRYLAFTVAAWPL